MIVVGELGLTLVSCGKKPDMHHLDSFCVRSQHAESDRHIDMYASVLTHNNTKSKLWMIIVETLSHILQSYFEIQKYTALADN